MKISVGEWRHKSRLSGLKKVLKNIQQMLAKLLVNKNINNTSNNHNEEEHSNNENPKTEKSKKNSSIDAEIIKGIQVHIVSLS